MLCMKSGGFGLPYLIPGTIAYLRRTSARSLQQERGINREKSENLSLRNALPVPVCVV